MSVSRSRVFLMEFIIAILFFLISTGIIVRVFVTAHEIREKANALTLGMSKAQSLVEYAKVSLSPDAYIEQLEKMGGIAKEVDDGSSKEKYIFYYDKNHYAIEVVCDIRDFEAGNLLNIHISVHTIESKKGLETYRPTSEICGLKAAKYYPKSMD